MEPERKPLLSICIPTYNRSEYLRKSLDSLVCQPEIESGEVEIVISDNTSTDGTEALGREYASRHAHVVYFRNESNVVDRNFPLSIARARGAYRKLFNDSLVYCPDALKNLLEIVRINQGTRAPIVFYNRRIRKRDGACDLVYQDKDAFVRDVGFWLTSIATFGIWEEDLALFPDLYEGCDTKLWQVYVTLKILAGTDKPVYLSERVLQRSLVVARKDFSYGLFDIFHTNFLGLLQPHVGKLLTQGTVDEIEKRLLLRYFADRIVDYRIEHGNFIWENGGAFIDCIRKAYGGKGYYRRFVVGLYWKLFQKRYEMLWDRLKR